MTKKISYVLGAAMVLLGVVGFFNDPVLGFFETDVYLDSIYIVFGLVLLFMGVKNAATGAKIVGFLALIVSILGFIPSTNTMLGFIETNINSSMLQVAMAVVLLYAGFAEKGIKNPIPKRATTEEQKDDQETHKREEDNFEKPEQPQM